MARTRRRRTGAVALLALLAGLGAPPASAGVEDPASALVRQLCDYAWVAAVCDPVAYGDPQYLTDTDPSPGHPFEQLVGAEHEHSSYSDGYPDTTPADYYTAARTGHDLSRAGVDVGVQVDFLWASEHSENEKIPITTSEACIDPNAIPAGTILQALLSCNAAGEPDHYRKWAEELRMAIEATDFDETTGTYTGFTGIRGFEYTNDVWNHLGVFFSRNVVNAKIDGAYLDPELFYDWLREPVAEGGGADALVIFNHPGGDPALSPFDGGSVHNELLAQLLGGGNWREYAYVPDVDERVAAMEVNGGDDLSWYLRALTNGWHIGAVANEDEHGLEWSSSAQGKTLLLTHGRSPRDHYFALQHHRTVAIDESLVGGAPGERAVVPEILYWADGTSVDDPAATVLGGTAVGPGQHLLRLVATGMPPGSPVVLLGNATDTPHVLGETDANGGLATATTVTASTSGEDWWVVVACPPGTVDCGVGEEYSAVTAPIWVRSSAAAPAAVAGSGTTTTTAGTGSTGGSSTSSSGTLPATGGSGAGWLPWVLPVLALGLVRLRLGVRRP